MTSSFVRVLLIAAVTIPVFAVSGCGQQSGAYRGGASVHVGYSSPWRWGGGYYPVPIPPDIIDPDPEFPVDPPPIDVPYPEPDFGGDFGGGDFFAGGDF